MKFACMKEIFKAQIKHSLIHPTHHINIKLLASTFGFFDMVGFDSTSFLKNLTYHFLRLLKIKIYNSSNSITHFEKEVFEMINNQMSQITKNTSSFPNYQICRLIFIFFDLYQNLPGRKISKGFMFENFNEEQNRELLNFVKISSEFSIKNSLSILKILDLFFNDLVQRFERDGNNGDSTYRSFKNLLSFFELMLESKLSFNPKIGGSDQKKLNQNISVLLYFVSHNIRCKLKLAKSNIIGLLLNLVKKEIDVKQFSEISSFESFESLFKLKEVLSFDREYIYFNFCQKILNFFYECDFKSVELTEFEEDFKDTYSVDPKIFEEAFCDLCYLKINKVQNICLKKGNNIFILIFNYLKFERNH